MKQEFKGELINMQLTRDRHFISNLSFTDKIKDNLTLMAILSYDTYDGERRKDTSNDPDRADHPLNMRTNFGEGEFYVKGQLNWSLKDSSEFAIGGEISRDFFGAGWGDSVEEMRLGDGGTIVNGPNSLAIRAGAPGSADRQDTPVFVGNGWSVVTYSLFSELKLNMAPTLTTLISTRMDKNTYSNTLISPRLAIINSPFEHHTFKLIAQQSLRINTGDNLYLEFLNNARPSTEKLRGLELIYSGKLSGSTDIDVAGFYNSIDIIDFQSKSNRSRHVGSLKLLGLELDLLHATTNAKIGLNYSYVKQLSWELNQGVENSSVSYSDYNEPLFDDRAIRGYGNDLNNWPNQSMKGYYRHRLSRRLTLHTDARLFYDYQGSKNGLTALQLATAGSSVESDVNRVVGELYDSGVYGYNFRMNMSLTLLVAKGLNLQVLAHNVIGTSNAIRYAFGDANNDAAPRKTRFFEEPRVFELRIHYSPTIKSR